MNTIYIDGKPYEVNPEHNLLHACIGLGFDLPYFCWHPALGSVGACRQCAVKQYKDENDTEGKMVMACMTAAEDQTRISIKDPDAEEFRRMVVEGLMLHHPHDCPVCDEGGECHLQDMTVMNGHNYRRSTFPKRTFRNQDLGPFVNHEMNRCIQCYRCVRFYRDYAGGRDLDAFHLRDTVFFGRKEDGALENDFAGNLVEICPTGVFTDKTLKPHYTRKWDLQMAPSVCAHCSMGCNVTVGERYGEVRRILNRYNYDINGYFLCDRGRFGYEFVNGDGRIKGAWSGHGDSREEIEKDAALDQLQEALRGRPAIGIGSPRASLESNFALRTLVGRERFYAGVPEREHRALVRIAETIRSTPAKVATLHDVENCDAVFVLGEDLPNSAPRMALSLRQAVRQQPARDADKLKIPRWNDFAVRELIQDRKGPLFIASMGVTSLDDLGVAAHAAPADLARFGCAVAHQLDPSAPDPGQLPEDLAELAPRVADALKNAERPLVVSGSSCRSEEIVEAAGNVALALKNANRDGYLAFVTGESNSLGLSLMADSALDQAFAAGNELERPSVVILENDLYQREPQGYVNAFLESAGEVIVLDHTANGTVDRADLVLPAATFADGSGTFVNHEMRAQRFFRVLPAEEPVQESWRWLGDVIGARQDRTTPWQNLDEIVDAIANELPEMKAVREAAPAADFRLDNAKIARQPQRHSGRTTALTQISMHEPKPPEDLDSALAFSMEGAAKQPPSSLTPYFWSPGWNSMQAVSEYQTEPGGELRGGSSGARLFEAVDHEDASYTNDIPNAFAARNDEWLLVPLYRIFGSEELSRLSKAIAQASDEPHIWLNPEDLGRIGVHLGDPVEITQNSTELELTAAADQSLPVGVAGIPLGLTGPLDLPAWSKLRKR